MSICPACAVNRLDNNFHKYCCAISFDIYLFSSLSSVLKVIAVYAVNCNENIAHRYSNDDIFGIYCAASFDMSFLVNVDLYKHCEPCGIVH